MHVNTRYINSRYIYSLNAQSEDVPLMEFMYLVVTCMPGESYRRLLGSLLCLRYIFQVLINSLVCWFCLVMVCGTRWTGKTAHFYTHWAHFLCPLHGVEDMQNWFHGGRPVNKLSTCKSFLEIVLRFEHLCIVKNKLLNFWALLYFFYWRLLNHRQKCVLLVFTGVVLYFNFIQSRTKT